MTVVNDTVLHNFADAGFFLTDNMIGTPQASSFLQASTIRLPGQVCRFQTAAATSTAVLPSILTGEASDPIVVVNDGANTLNVFAAPGENLRSAASAFGGTTGSIAVPAGTSAIFIKSVAVKKGGVATTNALNWSVGLNLMTSIQWVPGEGDAASTRAYGRMFHANVPVEVTDADVYEIEESFPETNSKGQRVLVTRKRMVTILEMARGNPTFRVEGEAPKEMPKAGRPRKPTTPEEYKAWAQRWISRSESTADLQERWSDEADLRDRCGVGELEIDWLNQFYASRHKQLADSEMVDAN